jgi:multicomponent Na+:H+ antiporter subunit E
LLRAISLFVTLLVFWLLLSGHYGAFLIGVGFACAGAMLWLARRMDLMDQEGHPIQFGAGVLWYWPWLAKEIVKSGWSVSRVILDPRLPIEPQLVRFKPSQRTDVGLATHANSITLTPGTISLEVAPGEFLVHALTRESAAGACAGGDMDLRVARLEKAG